MSTPTHPGMSQHPSREDTVALAAWRLPIAHMTNEGRPATFKRNKQGKLQLSITSNSRMHPMQRSSLTRRLRLLTAQTIEVHRLPRMQHIRVWAELHHPERGVKYLSDAGNLAAMSKILVDALQDPRPAYQRKDGKIIPATAGAGVVPNDGPRHVTQERDLIVRGSGYWREPRIVLVVEQVA